MHATAASRAVGKPVKVIYPREIDMRHEYYRPACISHYRALLDENGYPQALWARYAGQSLFWQMRRETVHEAGDGMKVWWSAFTARRIASLI